MRRILQIIGIVIGLIIVSVVGGYLYLRSSLPDTTGDVILTGLDGQVEIVRDEAGVPHIFASTDHDAYFAQGYVHAQDRLWQMEFQRRIVQGRLSEILGKETLNTDKFLRTLGVYRTAQEAWETFSPEGRMATEAYVAGINAWLNENHTLPLEFLILGVEPEPWTVYDSIGWGKMMAWDLGGNYDEELLRLQLIQALGPERAEEIMPGYPEGGITILSAAQISPKTTASLLEIDNYLQTNLELGGIDIGSNNWVVSGDHTASGKPLLANDPHLGAKIPSVWYLTEIQGDKLHVTGATFPGLPGIVIGHNEDIAWGVTNLGPDVQDLYIERINPKNPNQYEIEGDWVDMTIFEEKIYVKDQAEPILWAARSTRHGPLISDASESTPLPVALRWTMLDSDDTTLQSFIAVNLASNWDEFVTGLQDYVGPSQNFVYADQTGNIGYYGPGHIPIRAEGNGTVPVPGWDSEYEWLAFIPFEGLPQAYNPREGFIATANNRVVSDNYPYMLGSDWTPPYRAQRIVDLITEMIDQGHEITIEDIAAMQADQFSIQANELLNNLLLVKPNNSRQEAALAYLINWDGVASVDSIPAAIYQAWYIHLGLTVFEDDLNGQLYEDFATRKHEVFLAQIMSDENNPWCDNVLSIPTETCADIALTALDHALDDLESRLGSNMDNWAWGRLHITQYPHNPFSQVDSLKRFFHREIPNGGDAYTINVSPIRYQEKYLQYHVPSYRHIINVANFNTSLFMHTTGQSGNVLSSHYDDLIEKHQAVEYLPMTFGRANVQGDILVLKPN